VGIVTPLEVPFVFISLIIIFSPTIFQILGSRYIPHILPKLTVKDRIFMTMMAYTVTGVLWIIVDLAEIILAAFVFEGGVHDSLGLASVGSLCLMFYFPLFLGVILIAWPVFSIGHYRFATGLMLLLPVDFAISFILTTLYIFWAFNHS
jgi:hypothetical protein